MDVRFVYLAQPGKLRRWRSEFRAGYGKTLQLLDAELRHLAARDIIVQAGFPASQIRLDGWPYGKARPEHPGVILQFRARGSVLTFRGMKYATFEELVDELEELRRIRAQLRAARDGDPVILGVVTDLIGELRVRLGLPRWERR